MITQEFRDWVDDIKYLVERRVGKFCYVDTFTGLSIIHVQVSFKEGQIFRMSFDQFEFDKNNKKQRHSLAKYRRQNMAEQIEDFGDLLIKTAKKLK